MSHGVSAVPHCDFRVILLAKTPELPGGTGVCDEYRQLSCDAGTTEKIKIFLYITTIVTFNTMSCNANFVTDITMHVVQS